jgi:hypothetical protein
MLTEARTMGARRIETVVHPPTKTALPFAHMHGFVEFDPGGNEFDGLYRARRGGAGFTPGAGSA